MSISEALRQKPARAGRREMVRGEAPAEVCRDEAEGTRHENEDIGSAKLRAGAGTLPSVARQVAANSRRWWRNSDKLLNCALTIAYFDRLGVPRLS